MHIGTNRKIKLTGNLEYDNKIWDAILDSRRTDGWTMDYELEFLAREAIQADEAIEIGCYKGKSSNVMALAKHLTCIDDFKGEVEGGKLAKEDKDVLKEFKKTIGKLKNVDIIVVKEGKSKDKKDEFKDNTIDLIFIDSGHNYTEMKENLENYMPKLKIGGKMYIHDYGVGFDDKEEAIEEYLIKNSMTGEAIPQTFLYRIIK